MDDLQTIANRKAIDGEHSADIMLWLVQEGATNKQAIDMARVATERQEAYQAFVQAADKDWHRDIAIFVASIAGIIGVAYFLS